MDVARRVKICPIMRVGAGRKSELKIYPAFPRNPGLTSTASSHHALICDDLRELEIEVDNFSATEAQASAHICLRRERRKAAGGYAALVVRLLPDATLFRRQNRQ